MAANDSPPERKKNPATSRADDKSRPAERGAWRPPDRADRPAGRPGDPAEPKAAPDGGIPMLTDVLHLPRYEQNELPASLSQIDWSALELRVQENVMERLVRRSQVLLEEQIRDTLAAVVNRASRTLAVELHDALSQMLHETVARAVREELTRVHTEITNRGSPGPDPSGRR